jgi:threonylcarbamoyladenosine tRNA methylthiotransferase MtaB
MPSAARNGSRPNSRANNEKHVFRVAFHTFGCKLNQLETESIADSFRRSDFAVVSSGSPADLIIVNSCTVTSKSEQKARRFIRRALADNPSASVIVTGCYAQVEPKGVVAIDPRVTPVSMERKDALLDLPRFLSERRSGNAALPSLVAEWSAGPGVDGIAGRSRAFAFAPSEFSFHSRAFLKIQDGCDGACAYCLVRVARGPSSSLAAAEVLARVKKLEDAG